MVLKDQIKIENQTNLMTLITCLGIFVGSVIYSFITWLFNQFMLVVFSCEALGVFDATFLLDDPQNISNCIGVIFF